jgi:hypothetical protein
MIEKASRQHAFAHNSGQLGKKKAWPSLSHSSLINRKERYPKPPRAERKGIIPWLCLQKKHYQHAFARNAGKKNIAIPLTPLTQI